MHPTVRAAADLLRLRVVFAGPLLFCACYLLATTAYGGFSPAGLLLVALTGLSAFAAGLALNDYVDREQDAARPVPGPRDRFWRLFSTRPIPAGLIPPRSAAGIAAALALFSLGLALLLPWPQKVYVLLLLLLWYSLGIFLVEERWEQAHPFAQAIGRADIALFGVAGYLAAGRPDAVAVLLFLFLYSFALAFQGAHELADLGGDRARGIRSIPVLFGEEGAALWVAGFVAIHGIAALLFVPRLGGIARAGILLGYALLLWACRGILRYRGTAGEEEAALRALPYFAASLVLYGVSIALSVLP